MTPSQEMQALRDRIIELEMAMGLDVPGPPHGFRTGGHIMRSRLWQFFGLLIRRPLVTRLAVSIVWGADGSEKLVDVYLLKLRRFLKPHGVTIATDWGRGWYLDRASRERAIALRDTWLASDHAVDF